MAGLFGGGLERIRRQAAYMAPRIQREERPALAPIVQETQARTRDQAQQAGLIGGAYKKPAAQGWWAEVMSDPFTALGGRAAFDRKYAAQAAEDEARRMAPVQERISRFQDALPDRDFVASHFNPEEFGKNLAEHAGTQTGTFWDGKQWNQKPQDMMTVSEGAAVFDPRSGAPVFSNRAPPGPKYFNTGQAVVSIDPVTNKPTVLYRDPQNAGGSIGGFRTLSPDEAQARGYPKGTVVQIDNRGAEYVRSRPSTAQTGQPTEGERSAAMHVTVALNGLQKLVDMEGSGYNRAGFGEQFSTLHGENEKLYDQSAAEFIDGYLRAMTGAAATSTEIDTYRKQWFPQFGDTAAVVKQKAAGRLNALRGMKSKAGRAWNPSWDGVLAQLERQVGSAASNIAPPPSTPAAVGGEDLASYSTEELEQMLAEQGQ